MLYPSPGYQLLELGELDRYVLWPKDNVVWIALTHWLAARAGAEVTAVAPHVELHAVPILSPHGRYPGMGLRYLAEGPDPEKQVEAIIYRVLAEAQLTDFLDFVARSKIDYEATLAAIEGREPRSA